MSILSNLKAKSQTWEPLPGTKIEIKPLSVNDGLEELMMLDFAEDPIEMARAVGLFVHKTLKKSIPDATDDEIAELGIEHFESLMEVIKTVNNMKENDLNQEKLAKIKRIQEMYRASRNKKP